MTGGEAHEVKGYDALLELHDINPDRLLGDKGYDSDDIRNDLADRGIEPVIPPRSNRKTPIEYDREAYKRRNLIERCVNRLKQFRRIATRRGQLFAGLESGEAMLPSSQFTALTPTGSRIPTASLRRPVITFRSASIWALSGWRARHP